MRILGSPIRVVALGVGLALLWTAAYDAAQGSADAPKGASEHATLSDSMRTGPRLLKPPGVGVLGVDIAIEDADGQSMVGLHKALRRAERGEGQARLVFYGASHVASSLISGYVRRELQSRFGDAGHGFVLPVHPWRTYRHRDIQVESNYKKWETLRIRVNDTKVERVGLAGVAVESKRVGAFGRVRTAEQGDFGRSASFFELYYLKQPRGGAFEVKIDDRVARRISTRSSKTQPGYATFRVPDAPHRFEIDVKTRAPVRVFGVAVERERPGVIVDTLGINGSRARYQLLWDDVLFREHLRRRSPDLVVLAYGTNESGDQNSLQEYEEQLTKVVSRVREIAPEASCLLIGPTDRPVEVEDHVFEVRPRTADVIRIQHKVSLEQGCGFFDLVSFQGGSLAMVEWAAHDPPYASQDHIHLTRRGYERLGEVLLGAMLEGFDDGAPTEERRAQVH